MLKRIFPFLLLLLSGSEVQAQSMRLRALGFTGDRLNVRVGQTITLEVFADLQGVEASGFSLFVSLPDGPFQVVDTDTFRVGTQPFVAGPLFSGATVSRNILFSEAESPANVLPGLQMQYAAVIGAASNRRRTGTGIIATFTLRCVKPVLNGNILIDDNPVLETFLTLSDGVTVERFRTVQGIEITVTGISLRDIPDVILLPDQADSTTIGVLDNYLENILSPVDSIRWTREPASLDSIDIQIDPATRRVKITPLQGWRGRQQIVWTATELYRLLPGEAPLSASDVSRIVVNNPPQFTQERDAVDGARRDTVRFLEDQHPYLPGASVNDPRRAFRGKDLDFLVLDSDVLDPQTELDFAVLTYDLSTQPNITGEDDAATHELLVWSRPDFAGTDSLKIVVHDALRGTDSLRVIVIVQEVPDAPRFILQDRNLRISQGGEKRIALADFMADPDTPLDSLLLTWTDDPGGNFTVERTTGLAGDSLVFRGRADFFGEGQFVFNVADPLAPQTLSDRMVVNIASARVLPPITTPDDLKICLTPPGVIPALPPFVTDLDDLVEDPDNQDSEIAWANPFPTQSVITIDPEHVLTVSEPLPSGFVGFESTVLTATDPGGQTSSLNVRIYSTDGTPIAGGLPDLELGLGQVHNTLDLDNYYCDSDNLDEEMLWQVDVGGRRAFSGNFDAEDFSINIDPLTHFVTFAVAQSAVARVESVVFQVTSRPEGISSQDTMKVTIGAGGSSGGGFRIKPLGSLEVLVSQSLSLDLDDFLIAEEDFPKESLQWALSSTATHAISQISPDTHELLIFGLSSGTDTLSLTARDLAGNSQTVNTTVRVLGENEVLRLQSIPDLLFIAGQLFQGFHLNPFVLDRRTHPDSVLVWRVEQLGPSSIFVQVNGDSVLAVSSVVAQSEVVFVVRNIALNATGRDTVRVIALDPSDAARPLKPLPPLVFATGREDSSLVLDQYLPDEVRPLGAVRWSVGGQRITSPFIDPSPPHVLRLKAVGNSVGTDTLRLVADLGGGFTATGSLVVTVTEPVDNTTLKLEAVPNPFNPEFIDIFVVARRQLASTPTVVRSFEGRDSTVAVRQIEEDLDRRGTLIWSGNVRLRPQASGTIFFTTQAQTTLGTPVRDTTSVAIAPVLAGKPVVLEHEGVRVWLPAGAAAGSSVIVLQTREPEEGAAKRVAGEALALRRRLDLYPTGLALQYPGELRLGLAEDEALYHWQGGAWVRVGKGGRLEISRLGRYGVLAGQEEEEAVETALPRSPWLGANYPNPFNPETRIPFSLPQGSRVWVRLSIYNLSGQRVRQLVDGARAPGQYQVRWDGRSDAGERVGSGVYLYRLEAGDAAFTRRMTLVK